MSGVYVYMYMYISVCARAPSSHPPTTSCFCCRLSSPAFCRDVQYRLPSPEVRKRFAATAHEPNGSGSRWWQDRPVISWSADACFEITGQVLLTVNASCCTTSLESISKLTRGGEVWRKGGVGGGRGCSSVQSGLNNRSLQGAASLIHRPALRRIPTRAVHLLLYKHMLCFTQTEAEQNMYAFVMWRSEVSLVGSNVTRSN